MPALTLEVTPIPGLVVLRLDVREDSRGWFKENWQRQKMIDLGLPDFGPVQHNVSFNTTRGATRGIHTEPWDKFVSIVTGRVFGAWVDMREGATFGTTFTIEMDPSVAVFVPRGVGNSYQTLEDATTYSYLVNEHWRPGTAYPALALDDATAAIDWPIPLTEAEISDKDRAQPSMDAVVPMKPLKTLIIGALGQLGRALQADFPGSDLVDLAELDMTDAVAGRGLAVARVRRGAERGRLHRRRPRRDARWSGRSVGRQRVRAGGTGQDRARSTGSRSCTTPPTTSSTAPSSCTPRTSAMRRSASTASPRPPATSRSPPRRATTSSAPRG